jgi:hypothetical protein
METMHLSSYENEIVGILLITKLGHKLYVLISANHVYKTSYGRDGGYGRSKGRSYGATDTTNIRQTYNDE